MLTKKDHKASMLNHIKTLANCLKMQLTPTDQRTHNKHLDSTEQHTHHQYVQEAIAPHQIK